ncbi:hypothetical protein BVL65_02870 [Gardnerella swidsinskii]|uniref:Uncharacterized protein n=1 Tax=Gardnerella swidsinskii TaxID=2792979 RepID=A0ABM6GIV4_9BIFI|nr:hypothetical protein BVL65_02870 [Gardnerella vaginalis]
MFLCKFCDLILLCFKFISWFLTVFECNLLLILRISVNANADADADVNAKPMQCHVIVVRNKG